MVKFSRVRECSEEFVAVFYVSLIVGHFGVEDVVEGFGAEKYIADDPHALSVFVTAPNFAKPSHCG